MIFFVIEFCKWSQITVKILLSLFYTVKLLYLKICFIVLYRNYLIYIYFSVITEIFKKNDYRKYAYKI